VYRQFMLVLTLTVAFAAPLALVFVGPSGAAGAEQVLCQNKTFSGFTKPPFVLQGGSPGVRKVIRNCTFRNAGVPGIQVRAVDNLVVEDSTFENLRTNVPGKGTHGIALSCDGGCSNVVVRNSTFRLIGADGIQMGIVGRRVTNVTIENNEFVGNAATGENGVDVKGVDGPVRIVGNRVHGFRPCESPKLGGTQDCSGSPNGPGLLVHDGNPSGRANNVTLQGNECFDNTIGILVNTASNITVRNNNLHDNLAFGLFIGRVQGITVSGNTFSGNGTDINRR